MWLMDKKDIEFLKKYVDLWNCGPIRMLNGVDLNDDVSKFLNLLDRLRVLNSEKSLDLGRDDFKQLFNLKSPNVGLLAMHEHFLYGGTVDEWRPLIAYCIRHNENTILDRCLCLIMLKKYPQNDPQNNQNEDLVAKCSTWKVISIIEEKKLNAKQFLTVVTQAFVFDDDATYQSRNNEIKKLIKEHDFLPKGVYVPKRKSNSMNSVKSKVFLEFFESLSKIIQREHTYFPAPYTDDNEVSHEPPNKRQRPTEIMDGGQIHPQNLNNPNGTNPPDTSVDWGFEKWYDQYAATVQDIVTSIVSDTEKQYDPCAVIKETLGFLDAQHGLGMQLPPSATHASAHMSGGYAGFTGAASGYPLHKPD